MVTGRGRVRGKVDPERGQPPSQRSGDKPAVLCPGVEVPQLGAQHCRLQPVKACRPAHDPMVVPGTLPVRAKQPYPLGEVLVVGDDGARVAQAPEVWPVEAEAARVPSVPTRRPRYRAPWAWQASSITHRPASRATARMGSRSTVAPKRCPG